MESNFKVPFIKYDPEIKTYVSKFLHEHNPSLKIPVPIEEIAEFDLGIDIIPIPGLMDVLNIDGFISSNLKELEVDEYIYSNRPTRYRFTLAHEIGHIVMHVGILKFGKKKL
ncbi:MAG: ImmA/IrrE family metallo-endopeptidase [Elusimicrobiota bacterium]